MAHPQKEPLCPLTPFERDVLEHVARSHSEPAAHVERAKVVLAVAEGARFTATARPR